MVNLFPLDRKNIRLCKMKSLNSLLLSVLVLFCLNFGCNGREDRFDIIEGLDHGPMDPFKLGLIDPVALEAGAQYTLIVPVVIFLLGLLVIPTVLVITFLFVAPLLIPNTRKVERSFADNGVFQHPTDLVQRLLGSSEDCITRISCEILKSSKSSSFIHSITNGIFRFLNKPTRKSMRFSPTGGKDACDPSLCDIGFIKVAWENWSKQQHVKI